MDSIVQKFKNVFLEEAQAIINSYESDLLKLEQNPKNEETIESAFRSMHTLKGISGMYGFNFISEITHKLESVFQCIREKQIEFSKELFEITFSVIDHLRQLLANETLDDEGLKKEHLMLLETIDKKCILSDPVHSISNSVKVSDIDSKSIWQIILSTTESQYFRGISFMNIFRDLAEIGLFTIEPIQPSGKSSCEKWGVTLLTNATEDRIREIFMFVEDDCSFLRIADIEESDLVKINNGNFKREILEPTILEAAASNISSISSSKNSSSISTKSSNQEMKRISVTALKLDQLMFLVSELITVNSQAALSIKQNNLDALKTQMEKIDALSKNFRNNALELRLVPLNELLLRFQRLIRDLSKQLDKKVEFQVSGAECELDKSTIEQLSDPLMHIIRNCLDHGIEAPEQRIKTGKTEVGLLKLTAFHSGGKIVIEIEDDGNGIDLEKVKNKAIKLGMLQQGEQISKKELLDFIFIPGFSTAQNLSNISGRGVGMDIVRKKIQELKGEVSVETKEKCGTKFILTLQQSVSIVDSLLFRVSNSFFTIPISEIIICKELPFSEIESRRKTSTFAFGNQLIPFIDLKKNLALMGSYPEKVKLIILNGSSNEFAILADEIIGEHQAVLKPLNKTIQASNLINSVSQMGDGDMAFMIDTHELSKYINTRELTNKL
jgi:two-component system chemotaxis sensor kinase CheA